MNETTPTPASDERRGVYRKYLVERLNDPAGKHAACDYFVLDRVHDRYAPIALRAYAVACGAEFPELARDLLADPRLKAAEPASDEWASTIGMLGGLVREPPEKGGEEEATLTWFDGVRDLLRKLAVELGVNPWLPPATDDDADPSILDAAAVADILACEGTTSPSMEWDTCALALARSHEQLRADRSQLVETLRVEREERLLPGAPADAGEVARRIVDSFAANYRCDDCKAKATMAEGNKAAATRALKPLLVAWLRLHAPAQIPDDTEELDALRAAVAFDITDTENTARRRLIECDRDKLDELLTRCITLKHRHDEMEDVFMALGMPEGEPHPDAWWAGEKKARQAAEEAKRAELEATFKPFTCAYCDVREKTKEEIAAHIAGCEKHPLRAAQARIAELEAQLAVAGAAPQRRDSFDEWLRLCGVVREDNTFDEEQATKELADYHMLLGVVPQVYMAISGGRLSKPTYTAEVMIAQFEEEVQRRNKEAVADAREVWEAEHRPPVVNVHQVINITGDDPDRVRLALREAAIEAGAVGPTNMSDWWGKPQPPRATVELKTDDPRPALAGAEARGANRAAAWIARAIGRLIAAQPVCRENEEARRLLEILRRECDGWACRWSVASAEAQPLPAPTVAEILRDLDEGAVEDSRRWKRGDYIGPITSPRVCGGGRWTLDQAMQLAAAGFALHIHDTGRDFAQLDVYTAVQWMLEAVALVEGSAQVDIESAASREAIKAKASAFLAGTKPDASPVPIAPNIRRTVALLRSWGFETTDSGDGVANVEAGVGGARDYPHVSIVVEAPQSLSYWAESIHRRLGKLGITLHPIGTEPSAPCLQASFDPASGVAILDLMNVHDGLLPPEVATDAAPAAQEGR